MTSNTALLLYALVAVLGLIWLVVRLKLSAFVALIIASIFVGLCAGLSPARVFDAFQSGVGAVLGSIALIIGLGTILGKILAETGGAEVISSRLVGMFGPNRLPLAFMVIALIVGLPVFFGVGLVLLVPLLYATTEQHRLPLLKLGIPMVAGLSAAHGFIPPHPGPLAAIGVLQADLGKTILFSLPVALVSAFLAGPLFIRFFRNEELTVSGDLPVSSSRKPKAPPAFGMTLAAVVLPVALMAGATLAEILLGAGNYVRNAMTLIGHPVAALLIGVFFAYATLARNAGFNREQLLTMSEESLGPVAVILLVIGTGAGFSRVLIESGVGNAVAELATRWNLSAVPMGFVLAAVIRVATGSATVAITTCAGLVKPIADAQPGTNLELLVLAMGAGSLILSHVNDGGFWLVKGYLNLSVPQTLRTWTVLETILAIAGFACVLLLDLVF